MLPQTHSPPTDSTAPLTGPPQHKLTHKGERVANRFMHPFPIIDSRSKDFSQMKYKKAVEREALSRKQAEEGGEQDMFQRMRFHHARITPTPQDVFYPKIAKKYYGKKIAVLKKPTDALRLYQRSKYLIKMAIAWGKPRTYTGGGRHNAQPLNINIGNYEAMISRHQFHCKDGSLLLAHDIYVNEDFQHHLLPVRPSTLATSASLKPNLTWCKQMQNIKTIHLCLEKTDQGDHSPHSHVRMTVYNKFIKTLSMKRIGEDRFRPDRPSNDEVLKLYALQVCSLPSLLEVNLRLTGFDATFKKNFLTLFTGSNVPKWHIEDSFSEAITLYFESFIELLNELDFLSVDINNNTMGFPPLNGSDHNDPTLTKRIADLRAFSRKGLTFTHVCSDLGRSQRRMMQQINNQNNMNQAAQAMGGAGGVQARIQLVANPNHLNQAPQGMARAAGPNLPVNQINFNPRPQGMAGPGGAVNPNNPNQGAQDPTITDVTTLVCCCPLLESLCIVWDSDTSEILSDQNIMLIEEIKNIKNVILRPISDLGRSYERPEKGQPQFIFMSLADEQKGNTSDLAYLELIACDLLPPNYLYHNLISRYLTHTHGGLEQIYTVNCLNISFSCAFSKSTISNLFSSFTGLQKLEMKILVNHNRAWDESLPFANLMLLRELKLTLTAKDSGSSTFLYPQKAKWGKNLAKSLAQMQYLEIFDIQDRDYASNMTFTVFYGLLKALSQLTRLKRLIIYTKTVREDMSSDEDDLMPSQWNQNVRARRKVLKGGLEELVEKIKASNKALEVMKMQELQVYGTTEMVYEKPGCEEDNEEKKYRKRGQSYVVVSPIGRPGPMEICYLAKRQNRLPAYPRDDA